MVSTDPIADMLTRIRNAIAVQKTEVSLPHNGIKEAVAKILKENGYIANISVNKEDFRKEMTLVLPEIVTINEISRISKPGRRVYAKVNDIPVVKQGRGIVIVSTSQGVMAGADAKKQKLGGEILCQVY
ncbi:MAG: small subunit ribosomal protein S8 [Candidatus Saccharimonadales bacterium]|jgi:small subunit ribosomal protein S8